MTLQYSVAVRNARLDVVESTTGASPVLEIRTGAPPVNCAAADSGTVLATVNLPSDWMLVASEYKPMAPPSASISRTNCPFACPPIAGFQDIFTTESRFWVSIMVSHPSREEAIAASIPAWPEPMTIT